MILALLLSAAWAAQAQPPTARRAEYFTLALDWQPSFCERLPDAAECRGVSDRWTLHGLWPDLRDDPGHTLEYCGVSAKEKREDSPARWCALPAPAMKAATDAALTALMPGRTSCLERHEWLKHGTCSGLSADAYFAEAEKLAAQALRSSGARYLRGRAGKTALASELLGALKADWGEAAPASAGLYCRAVGGKPVFSELKLRLRAPLEAGAPLRARLVAAEPGDLGDCPSEFLVPSARALPRPGRSDILPSMGSSRP